MTMQLIRLIHLLMFSLLLSLFAFSQSGTKIFKSEDGDYKISYPSDWNNGEKSGNIDFIIRPSRTDNENNRQSAKFRIESFKLAQAYEKSTIKEMALADEEYVRAQKIDGELKHLNSNFKTINGIEWWFFEYTLKKSTGEWHEQLWKTLHNSHKYTVSYGSEESNFDSYYPQVIAMVNSFVFLKKDLTVYDNKPSEDKDTEKQGINPVSKEKTNKVSKTPGTTANSKNEVLLKKANEEELSPVAIELFKTIRMLSPNNTGKVINVELPNKDKNTIAQSSNLKLSEDEAKFYEEAGQKPFNVFMEAGDFDSDGKYELILKKDNSKGPNSVQEFSIYRKRDYKEGYELILNSYGTPKAVEPKVHEFYTILVDGLPNSKPYYRWSISNLKYKLSGEIAESKKDEINIDVTNKGGSTPQELAQILLRALKTNDLKLWMSCQHPVYTDFKAYNEFRFKQHRESLIGAGITNWNLVEFNRVTYTTQKEISNENNESKTEIELINFVIEFTYKNKEFLGYLGKMGIDTYKGKYFFYKQFEGAYLGRIKK